MREDRLNQSQNQKESGNLKGDFQAVIDCIEKRVLSQNQTVSMSLNHELYGIHIDDWQILLLTRKRRSKSGPGI